MAELGLISITYFTYIFRPVLSFFPLLFSPPVFLNNNVAARNWHEKETKNGR